MFVNFFCYNKVKKLKGKRMRRKELLERISEKTNLPRAIVNDTLNALGEVIAEGLSEGKTIKPHKMATYSVKKIKAHKGKVCGLEYFVPDYLLPKVKATKILKDRLKNRSPKKD